MRHIPHDKDDFWCQHWISIKIFKSRNPEAIINLNWRWSLLLIAVKNSKRSPASLTTTAQDGMLMVCNDWLSSEHGNLIFSTYNHWFYSPRNSFLVVNCLRLFHLQSLESRHLSTVTPASNYQSQAFIWVSISCQSWSKPTLSTQLRASARLSSEKPSICWNNTVYYSYTLHNKISDFLLLLHLVSLMKEKSRNSESNNKILWTWTL